MAAESAGSRLQWYAARLAAMSPAEVAHRALEQHRRISARRRVPDFAAEAGRAAFVPPDLPWLRDGLRQLSGDADLIAEWQEVARNVQAGRFRFFGNDWPVAPIPDWHLDPETGRHWPSDVYCFDVPYRHATGFGDVKNAWELNRLQYLQPVAALAALTGDAELGRLCARHIESWIDANPPFRGVHWASMIELAHRVVSILVVAAFVGRECFDQRLCMKLGAALAAHGWWIERFPSRYSSANNHAIAEACGLYLLGVLLAEFPMARGWEAKGRTTLESEALKQFHADGVPAEQSPTYGAFSLEWLTLAGRVGAKSGRPFSDGFTRRSIAACRFLRAITDAGGHQPAIGDDDGSHVLASGFAERGYVDGVLAALAAVTGTTDVAPPVRTPHLREAIFGRAAAAPEIAAGVRHFPEGGYTVARSGAGSSEVLWIMDHGPLGYLSIAAHGHADALSVWLHLGGRPVLVDAGTFVYYGAEGAWRDRFRATAAHNTLTLDGAGSSRTSGPFNWSRNARVTMREVALDPASWAVEAEHDGFQRSHGVRHRRRLQRQRDGTCVLSDRLVGAKAALPVEIGFLVDPELGISAGPGAWTIADAGRPILRIRHRGGLSGEIRDAWHSPAFGRKQPAMRLCFAGPLAAGMAAETIFELPAG
ncbi:MAG TPA: alginate lyase family protein [Candidatus Cybelea sp.]|nr:alginate lyase family protein [Candidatus Cybelea sp.]